MADRKWVDVGVASDLRGKPITRVEAEGLPSRAAAPGKYALIWDVVRRIPRGRVASYGQVARLAGLAEHARLAGYALHASATDRLPWHRVVNAEGRLSLARTDASAGVTQRLRLEQEGVRFDARGRVDMTRHRWEPAAPLRKRKVP